jgi:hypothetical protein
MQLLKELLSKKLNKQFEEYKKQIEKQQNGGQSPIQEEPSAEENDLEDMDELSNLTPQFIEIVL